MYQINLLCIYCVLYKTAILILKSKSDPERFV